ncbi:MAG: FAD binding domain-containing protein, partial [Rhodospirillales bacterium]|nr:FAD binding domain-containing protein [Rhodospirillales bacterium]
MKAAPFDYARPDGLDEVLAILADAGGDGMIIAGGQTLVPMMAMRLARPTRLVDINKVAELDAIEAGDDALRIAAGTRQARALGDPEVARKLPLLAKALGFIGHVQTRNRGTVG